MNRVQTCLVVAFLLPLSTESSSRASAQTLVDFREAVRSTESALMTVVVDAAHQQAEQPQGRRIEILRPDGAPLNQFRGGLPRRDIDRRPLETNSAAFAIGDSMIVAFVGDSVTSVTVQAASDDQADGKVVALDHVTGLAVIQTDLAPESGLVVSAAETEPGQPVVAAWITERGLVTDSGMVSTRPIATASGVGTTPTIDFGTGRQMTGAPVIDATGIVVGVLVPSHTGGLVCVRSTHLLRLIESATGDTPKDLKRGLIGIQFEGGGPLVQQVSPDSAAQQAGIAAGDLIRRVGPTSIRDSQEVVAAVADARAGETLEITVVRGDQTITLPVTLQEHPDQRIARHRPTDGTLPLQQAFELRDGQLVPLEIDPDADPFPPGIRRFPMEDLFRNFQVPGGDLQTPGGPFWRTPRPDDGQDDGKDLERSDVEKTLKELQRQMEQLNQQLGTERD
ncbi:Serine endoprotease DegS [Stieleria maiorica]|uniref:Serine endoprotease DegS n=1 Tax=Stieleria maiorica TaxID=2795974 RepID=A0A5B9MND4_9BACT|nr:S1C family serine protease [Stieleria maiorica]QEG02454.1 Serine endoprotease DegS [Stieleria maiorica]